MSTRPAQPATVRTAMPAHTPGPWTVDSNPELPPAVIRDDAMGDGIAEIGERTPENEANARLIAAAPDDSVAQLRAWLADSGLTREDFARRVLMRNPATLYRWISGKSPIPTPIRDRLSRRRVRAAPD